MRIGVVFVHGIGQQTQSETVREFTEPLYDWVTRWFRARRDWVSIDEVELSYGNPLGGRPAHYELHIPSVGDHPPQTWVLAEGFWADRVTPPSLKTMLGWGRRALLPVIRRLALNAIHQPWQRRRWIVEHLKAERASTGQFVLAFIGTLVDALSQLLLMLAYWGLLALGGVLIVVLYPVAVIPLPQLQRFVLVRILAPILTDFIGDFQVYASDRLMALHMRNGVIRAIQWLARDGKCEKVCVIGHSGGGLIGFDAVVNGPVGDVGIVTKLITMGSALNEASEIERERREALPEFWEKAELPPPLFRGNTRADLHWVDIWAAYDPVAMGEFRGSGTKPDDSITATNEMNLLSDHGAYFRNDEEVISLWAQEISTPSRPRKSSRFWLRDYERRVMRRWERVITLVAWRLIAMSLFAAVALLRRERMADDGRRIWAAVNQLPGAEGLAGIVSGVFEVISRIAGGIADITAPLPVLPTVFGVLREFLRPGGLEPLTSTVIATVVIGALFILDYWLVTLIVYEPWRREERAESVFELLPDRTMGDRVTIWARALGVPVALAAFAFVMLVL